MATKTLILWNYEPYDGSPAHKTFEVEWSGNLYKATLYLDLNPDIPPFYGCATKVVVNGFEYDPKKAGDPCDVMIFDITDAIQQGRNEVAFYFNPWLQSPWIRNGFAYGYVTIEAQEVHKIKPAPPQPSPWSAIPWIVGGVLAIGIFGVIAYFLTQMPKK